jgi:hypothetical protein
MTYRLSIAKQIMRPLRQWGNPDSCLPYLLCMLCLVSVLSQDLMQAVNFLFQILDDLVLEQQLLLDHRIVVQILRNHGGDLILFLFQVIYLERAL